MSLNSRSLVDFFARSLTTFTSSAEPFRVLCTLTQRHDPNGPPQPRRPQQCVRNLIVLDSSFNPPTTAHAEMIRSASNRAGGARVLLLLAVENADKAPKPASFPLRLSMMEGFGRELLGCLDGREVDVGVTRMPYFHDKARAIAASGFYGEAELTFLAGYDTLVRIFNPKYYGAAVGGQTGMQAALDPFFGRAKLRVTMRTDGQWGGREEQEGYLRELAGGKLEGAGGRGKWTERVEMVEGFGGEVSSSRVREMVKEGRTAGLDGLVSAEVRSWIDKEALYK